MDEMSPIEPDYEVGPMTRSQKLRKLQMAVDHIAAVLEAGREGESELSEALDLIHHAEIEIEGGT